MALSFEDLFGNPPEGPSRHSGGPGDPAAILTRNPFTLDPPDIQLIHPEANLDEQELPPRNWIVEGWIPHLPGHVGVFLGRGGSGKTHLAMQLLRRRAQGRPWLDQKTFPGRSLFVTLEEDALDVRRMIQSQRSVDPEADGGTIARNIAVVTLSGLGARFAVKHGVRVEPNLPLFDKFIGSILPVYQPDFVIFETLGRIAPSEDNEGMTVALQVVEQLAAAFGATALLIAHPTKAAVTAKQTAQATAVRGGSAIVDGCRFGFALEEQDYGAGRLVCIKARGAMPDPIPLVRIDSELGCIWSCSTEEDRRVTALIKYMREEPDVDWTVNLVEKVKTDTGARKYSAVQRDKVTSTFSAAVSRGLIEATGNKHGGALYKLKAQAEGDDAT